MGLVVVAVVIVRNESSFLEVEKDPWATWEGVVEDNVKTGKSTPSVPEPVDITAPADSTVNPSSDTLSDPVPDSNTEPPTQIPTSPPSTSGCVVHQLGEIPRKALSLCASSSSATFRSAHNTNTRQ